MTYFDSKLMGKRIKKCRLDKGYTQKQLAEMVGVSINTIINAESGKNNPSVEVLYYLSSFLGVSADYLLGF